MALAFVRFAERSRGTLLDVGCAYGVATIPALQAGATVIGCDIAADHLDRLQKLTLESLCARLQATSAAFPYDLDLDDQSLDGVHTSNVLHFLDGPEVEQALRVVYRWLKPRGQVFVLVASPYLSMGLASDSRDRFLR